MAVLLNNADTDQSETLTTTGSQKVLILRADDFGGATVEISIAAPSDPSERYHILSGGSFISADEVRIDFLPAGVKLKAELTNATGTTNNVFVEVL